MTKKLLLTAIFASTVCAQSKFIGTVELHVNAKDKADGVSILVTAYKRDEGLARRFWVGNRKPTKIDNFVVGLWHFTVSGYCQTGPPAPAQKYVHADNQSSDRGTDPKEIDLKSGCGKLKPMPATAALVLPGWMGRVAIQSLVDSPGNQANAACPIFKNPAIWSGRAVTGDPPKPVVGARVTAYVQVSAHSAMIRVQSSRTEANGCFQIRRPTEEESRGEPYFLSVEKQGFEPFLIWSEPIGNDPGAPPSGEVALTASKGETLVAQSTGEMMHRYVIAREVLETLPIRGVRSFDGLALMAPGVFPAPEAYWNTGPGVSPGIGAAGQFAINGLRARDNNFTVDGSDNNDEIVGARRQGFLEPAPMSIDSTEEFDIITAAADARFGRNIGGQVSAVSKTGAHAFHGQLYGFSTFDGLRARNPFDVAGPATLGAEAPLIDNVPVAPFNPQKSKDSFQRHQFGAVVGGALPSRRLNSHLGETFFSVSFERQVVRAIRTTNFSSPTAAERTIDPSWPGARGHLRSSLPGSAAFSLYPFPNNPLGPFGEHTWSASLPADGKGRLLSQRVDQPFRRNGLAHSISIRYQVADEKSTLPSAGGAIASSLRANVSTKNLALTHVTSSNRGATNTFRFSFGKTSMHFDDETGAKSPFTVDAPLLLDAARVGERPAYVHADSSQGKLMIAQVLGTCCVSNVREVAPELGQVSIAGYSAVGIDPFHFPQASRNHTYQFADTFLITRPKDTIAIGFDIRRVWLENTMQKNIRIAADFYGLRDPVGNTVYKPVSLAAAGVPARILETFVYSAGSAQTGAALNQIWNSLLNLRRSQGDLFAQYDRQVHPNLLLSAGFRLEVNSLPKNLDQHFLSGFTSAGFAAADFQTTFGHDRAGNDPRIGLAWRISPSSSLRAGWGVHTGQFPLVILNESRSSFPQFIPVNIARPEAQYLTSIVRCFTPRDPGTGTALGNCFLLWNPVLNLVQAAPSLKNPYAFQQHVTLARELTGSLTGSLSYVGTLGRKLLRIQTPNGGIGRGSFQLNSISNYAALFPHIPPAPFPWAVGRLAPVQAPEKHTGCPGPCEITAARTWFEGTANSAYHSLQAELRTRFARQFQFGAAFTYAHAIDDVSDFFDTAGSYALPQNSFRRSERGSAAFDARVRFVTHFVADAPASWSGRRVWQRFAGGWRLAGIYTAQTGQPYTVNSVVDSNMDGNLTDRPNAVLSGVDPYSLLNPAGDGALGRNTFRAPGVNSLDVAVVRQWNWERSSLVFRAESFNLFNHTQLATPVRLAEAPGFGKSVATLVEPRTVQFALKLRF